jgi:hypothetical protein
VNNFKLSELERQTKLPFTVSEPGVEFVLEENVTFLTADNRLVDAIMYLLNNRLILTKKIKSGEKYIESVNFKHGAAIMEN